MSRRRLMCASGDILELSVNNLTITAAPQIVNVTIYYNGNPITSANGLSVLVDSTLYPVLLEYYYGYLLFNSYDFKSNGRVDLYINGNTASRSFNIFMKITYKGLTLILNITLQADEYVGYELLYDPNLYRINDVVYNVGSASYINKRGDRVSGFLGVCNYHIYYTAPVVEVYRSGYPLYETYWDYNSIRYGYIDAYSDDYLDYLDYDNRVLDYQFLGWNGTRNFRSEFEWSPGDTTVAYEGNTYGNLDTFYMEVYYNGNDLIITNHWFEPD